MAMLYVIGIPEGFNTDLKLGRALWTLVAMSYITAILDLWLGQSQNPEHRILQYNYFWRLILQKQSLEKKITNFGTQTDSDSQAMCYRCDYLK